MLGSHPIRPKYSTGTHFLQSVLTVVSSVTSLSLQTSHLILSAWYTEVVSWYWLHAACSLPSTQQTFTPCTSTDVCYYLTALSCWDALNFWFSLSFSRLFFLSLSNRVSNSFILTEMMTVAHNHTSGSTTKGNDWYSFSAPLRTLTTHCSQQLNSTLFYINYQSNIEAGSTWMEVTQICCWSCKFPGWPQM